MALFRQPLLQREVTIIRNMKKKLKLPVARIAIAVGRTKKTVYKALDPTWKLIKRGRQDALTPGDLISLGDACDYLQGRGTTSRREAIASRNITDCRRSLCKIERNEFLLCIY